MQAPRPNGLPSVRGAALALLALLSAVPFQLDAASSSLAKTPETLYHIQIVTDLHSLPSEYWSSTLASDTNPLIQELLPLNSTRRHRLRDALDRLPPLLRGAISKLSVAVYEEGNVAGDAYGNNIIINAAILSNPTQLNHTLAHEATHCFQALMELTHHWDSSNISATVMDAVKKADDPLYNSSINRIFRRLQATAIVADEGYPPYAGPQWETRYTSPGAAISDGFVSPYAANDPRDDLAEIVAMFVDAGFANHGYCSQFEGLDGQVEPQQALAFAKLNFVRALGLIQESQYRQCVRGADPVDARLISMGSREFAGDLSHGTQTVRHENLDEDWLMWRIKGVASDARLEIRLRLRQLNQASIGSPIGFYKLDTVGSHGFAADALTPIAAQNVITFQRTDTSNPTELMAYTRISGDGYVLITDFSADLVKGYAFNVPFYTISEVDPPPTDRMDIIWFLWER